MTPSAERKRQERQRKAAAGLVRVEVIVPKGTEHRIRRLAADLRDQPQENAQTEPE